MPSVVYLIPTVLSEGQTSVLPSYILDAVKDCQVFFVENERTARRFLKLLWKEMPIDSYGWVNMKEVDTAALAAFREASGQGKNIGIISEAGCPGIADPGQELVALAQELRLQVKPLVGPNSILLALMASGMNGQHFSFHGYLPIDKNERTRAIQQLEQESRQKNATQIFIETPYRNNQMLEALCRQCHPATRICIACDLTSHSEFIITKPVKEWKTSLPDLHKKPVIFLLQS